MEHGAGDVYRFGRFELDTGARTLTCDGDHIPLPGPALQLLIVLALNAGRMMSKESLIAAVWDDAVGESTFDRALWTLRDYLGHQPDGSDHIKNFARQGYMFMATVARVGASRPIVVPEVADQTTRVLVECRAAIDTLDVERILVSIPTLEDALRDAEDVADLQVALAMAYALRYESTRDHPEPDREAIDKARAHAHRAVHLAPESAEARSTLAFVLGVAGNLEEAAMAGKAAVDLEDDNLRHWVRFGYVSWGENRIRAGNRTLQLFRDFPTGHWFIGTVFIGRQVFEPAMKHLCAGCAAQDAQPAGDTRFPALGLNLMRGGVLDAQGKPEQGLDAFHRELKTAHKGQLYERECLANTVYSIGAVERRLGRMEEARAAFAQAQTIVPRHGRARAALAAMDGVPLLDPPTNGEPVERAFVTAIGLVGAGNHEAAAALVLDEINRAPQGPYGWQLPIEPSLHVSAHPDVWLKALVALRHRAG